MDFVFTSRRTLDFFLCQLNAFYLAKFCVYQKHFLDFNNTDFSNRLELGQLFGLVIGTFDIADLLFYIFGMTLPFILFTKSINLKLQLK